MQRLALNASDINEQNIAKNSGMLLQQLMGTSLLGHMDCALQECQSKTTTCCEKIESVAFE